MTQLGRLVELHLDALYERNAEGLILRMRGTDRPAPRVHLVRTVEGNRWLLGVTLAPASRATLGALFATEPTLLTVEAMEHRPPATRDAVLALLASHSPVADEYRGPALTFPSTLPASAHPVEVLPTPEAAHPYPAVSWLASFVDTDRPVVVARDLEGGGEAVAFCHSARLGPASAEAGLGVVEAYRRRGLAKAVTLGWAHAIRAAGREPLYSTWWGNEASRATARSLGLKAYAEDWHID